jgi:methanogenic corrinoid protein MtbC1
LSSDCWEVLLKTKLDKIKEALTIGDEDTVIHLVKEILEAGISAKEILKEKNPDILALSALLTSTGPMIKKTIETVTVSGLRDPLKIIVGGAPVTQELAAEVGADGYAPDAGSASKLAKSLLR